MLLAFLRMRALFVFILFFLSLASRAEDAPKTLEVPEPSWAFARQQLVLAKFSEPFIAQLKKDYDKDGFEEVIRLNVLLFLKKSDYHGPQVNDQAISETTVFSKENAATLKKAERQFGVSGKVVASLLFLESRYGKNAGHFHVPSVYVHLIQSPRKDVQDYLLTQTSRYTESVTPEQKMRILTRTHDKAKFALKELHALERVFKWKWKLGSEFTGSFSGAFGMPQFLPSSYISFARAVAPKSQPDLSHADDAIMSVAFYLRQHGWKARASKSHTKALMAYNNSSDYAAAILSLSEKL